jgi:SHS2 domain-containing protein
MINQLDDFKIEALASGSSVKNYRVNMEVKAATYHQLRIEKRKSGWVAEIIFDV